MHTFLTRLAQLDSIQMVVLVSGRGEVLFQAGAASDSGGGTARWQELIAGLGGSPAAELSLADRRYYIHDLGLGHVIVGMENSRSLERVKKACSEVQGRLADPSVRKRVLRKMMDEAAAASKPAMAQGEGGGQGPAGPQLQELLGLGKKEAIDRLLLAIESAARDGRFDQAETMRDWLMRIDSLALRQSIQAAELIEQAKLTSVDRRFRHTWQELELALGPEDFSTLYHDLTPRVVAKDELVVRQGEFTSSLFFINSGRVQLYVVSSGREMPLQLYSAGAILGVDNFFEASVWTVNAKSLGAELSLLTREKLQRHHERYPALAGKLRDFCRRAPSVNALFSSTGRTRRRSERKKAAGKAIMVVLDDQGRETAIGAKGNILDLSKGGLSFALRVSQKEKAEALLGRNIKITMQAESAGAPVTCMAKVMAVRCSDYLGSDYSLHVEFPQELDSAQLQRVLGRDRVPRK